MATTQFIILTLGRTGSNYLCSLYSKHPQIHMDGELFNKRELDKKFHPTTVWAIRRWPYLYMLYRNLKGKKNNKTAIGFKLLLPQWPYSIEHGLSLFKRKEYKPIYLFRRNRVAQLISITLANQTKKWVVNSSNEYTDEKTMLDLALAREKMKLLDTNRKQLKKISQIYPGLVLYYEDHLAGPEQLDTLSSLMNPYLGIDPHPLVSGMLKTDQRSDDERFGNLSELLSMLREMGFEKEVNYYLAQQNNHK